MPGSIFGTHFKITTWGESHGAGIGVVIDGCPAGLTLSEQDVQKFLDRRKPGQSPYATLRKEEDKVEILSGIFEGQTTGSPISLMVHNKHQESKDYSDIANVYRPGHADYAFDAKYGLRDYRGGGRSSGRETIGRVAAGAVAAKLLGELGVSFLTYTRAIGPIRIKASAEDLVSDRSQVLEAVSGNPLHMPETDAALEAQKYLDACMEHQDSAGGVIEGIVTGLVPGIGEPVFEKLDANLAKAIFSIGAVKGFEIGDGFAAALAKGSDNNDEFRVDENGIVKKESNHSGGVLGGISDGSPLVFRAAIKPTPSIAAMQSTVNKQREPIQMSVKGRHDPVIVPRAVVVVEAMAALVVADLYLANLGVKMENLRS